MNLSEGDTDEPERKDVDKAEVFVPPVGSVWVWDPEGTARKELVVTRVIENRDEEAWVYSEPVDGGDEVPNPLNRWIEMTVFEREGQDDDQQTGESMDIKPCPFCGNSGEGGGSHPLQPYTRNDQDYDWWRVGCDQCDCYGPGGSTPKEAVEQWNNQYLVDSLKETRSDLEAERDELREEKREMANNLSVLQNELQDEINELRDRIGRGRSYFRSLIDGSVLQGFDERRIETGIKILDGEGDGSGE